MVSSPSSSYAEESRGASPAATYYEYGPAEWPADDVTYMRPALPRHPLVAQIFADVGGDRQRTRDASVPRMDYSSWRLRWCGLLLLGSTTMQSVAVGGQLSGAPSCGSLASILTACALLATLTALWALLSQLLLWSDAAMLQVPRSVALAVDANTPSHDSLTSNGSEDMGRSLSSLVQCKLGGCVGSS